MIRQEFEQSCSVARDERRVDPNSMDQCIAFITEFVPCRTSLLGFHPHTLSKLKKVMAFGPVQRDDREPQAKQGDHGSEAVSN